MIHAHTPAFSPVISRLAVALDQYEADVEKLVGGQFEREQRWRVARELEEIQHLRGAVPRLAVDILKVVACHVELVRSLLRRTLLGSEVVTGVEIAALQERHRQAVASMRVECATLLK